MNKIKIACPHCGKKNIYRVDNPYRPFCSERCKMIDFGKWADESHKIPGPSAISNDEEISSDDEDEQ